MTSRLLEFFMQLENCLICRRQYEQFPHKKSFLDKQLALFKANNQKPFLQPPNGRLDGMALHLPIILILHVIRMMLLTPPQPFELIIQEASYAKAANRDESRHGYKCSRHISTPAGRIQPERNHGHGQQRHRDGVVKPAELRRLGLRSLDAMLQKGRCQLHEHIDPDAPP